MSLLKIEGLTKSFGGLVAVNNYRLNLPRERIYGLIGPNGAGKTTIFNLITGFLKPDSGRIIFNNVDITGKRPDQIAKYGIARTFQTLRLFKNLSVIDNIRVGSHIHYSYSLYHVVFRLPKYAKKEKEIDEYIEELLQRFDLEDYKNDKVGKLPYGIQKKVEIARALAMKPKLILLDEPSAGMNPSEAEELENTLRNLAREHSLTMFIIEHRMPFVMGLCEYIQVLNHGKLICEGPPKKVREDPEVIKVYLGGEYA